MSCDEKLKSLITTCSNLGNPFKDKLLARIDSKENNVYSIQLYVKDSGENSENVVGSIRLNLNNNTLVDITFDDQNGTPLKYNKELFDSHANLYFLYFRLSHSLFLQQDKARNERRPCPI